MKKFYLFTILAICCIPFIHAQEFVNEINFPPKIDQDDYHLNVIETEHNFNPNGTGALNSMIKTFAFEDANNPGSTTILGPTLIWKYQHQLTPKVTNKLTEVTTCHWHGGHVPQFADGGPHQRIMPGTSWNPFFEVKDKSATMWYHPHAMDLTYRHVQMGLSGMIIVEDPVDGQDDPILSQIHQILPTDYAVNDFPVIFQTKKFKLDAATNKMVIQADQGFKNNYEYLVNGIIDPYMTAPADMIRLRILNGDGKFCFNLAFERSDGADFPAHMIATDAGYMDRTYEISEILMAPGERTEWLLDLRGLQGDTLYIKNLVSGMPDGIIGDSSTTVGYAQDRNLLRIIVGPSSGTPSPIIGFPIPLHPSEAPPLSKVTNERLKVLRRDSFLIDGGMVSYFNIDSSLMDMMVVNDIVKLDSTEIWTIDNQTDFGHPWHIHDIHFWVTEIIDAAGDPLNPSDHPQLFKGPKDNIFVQPGWKVSYIATFDDFGTEVSFDSSYMYHCHILPHEDKGMMGQFVVWNGIGNPTSTDEDPELSTIPMKVYPNPAAGVFYIQGASAKSSTLRFIDVKGQLVKEMRLPGFDGAIQINSHQLPEGLLIMDWQTHEGKAINKIMIKHQ